MFWLLIAFQKPGGRLMERIKERVIEDTVVCSKSQSDIQAKLNQVQSSDAQMLRFRKSVDYTIAGLRSVLASITSRKNNIELTLSQIGNLSNKQYAGQHATPAIQVVM
jgi:hypothetical protein